MLYFIFFNLGLAGESNSYALGDTNVGMGVSYGQGRLNTTSLGMNFNLEGGAGVVSKDTLPTSIFFHGRVDFDVGGIYSHDDEQVDLGMDWRINLHSGFQFFGFLPVNFAMKDARFGFYRDSFVTHGLYGVGMLLPKEYFRKGKNSKYMLNASINIGARVREDFSTSPAAIHPELLFMSRSYSARIGFLQTFGSNDSNEFTATGMIARKNLIMKGSQIGFQWRYGAWQDFPTGLDETQLEIMIVVGGNPKFNF